MTYCGARIVVFPGIHVSPIRIPSGAVNRGKALETGGYILRASLMAPLR